MADQCSETLRSYKIAQIVLSALTSSGVVSILFVDEISLKIATAVVSFLSLLFSSYLKSFDPGGTAQKHRDAAASLWPIRESYLSLLTDMRMNAISMEQATARRDDLQKKLAAIYKGAPQTNAQAYEAARSALKENEEFTFSDSEIDKFVPASLRKANGQAD
ncbi:MAG TPA: SLATT domain-containing protein [Clostridia bacterium]|nr:SLATT domain-containing protein [Clostridia bacterium]